MIVTPRKKRNTKSRQRYAEPSHILKLFVEFKFEFE